MKTFEELREKTIEMGIRTFKHCYDDMDFIRVIDDLNISRETHYDEDDITVDENGVGHCDGYVTIELGRNSVPFDIAIEVEFEDWDDEESIWQMESYQYVGWAE